MRPRRAWIKASNYGATRSRRFNAKDARGSQRTRGRLLPFSVILRRALQRPGYPIYLLLGTEDPCVLVDGSSCPRGAASIGRGGMTRLDRIGPFAVGVAIPAAALLLIFPIPRPVASFLWLALLLFLVPIYALRVANALSSGHVTWMARFYSVKSFAKESSPARYWAAVSWFAFVDVAFVAIAVLVIFYGKFSN